MRAVNVGGHRTFRPRALAASLAHLGVVSVGAAGTFVVPGRPARARLRAAFARGLDFEPELIVCEGAAIARLVAADPFAAEPEPRRAVSVLAARPAAIPRLPLLAPAGSPWEVRVLAIEGPFALSVSRRLSKSPMDANAVVERALGVRATTRTWNTIVTLATVVARVDGARAGHGSVVRTGATAGRARPRRPAARS